jgi:pyrimidine-nucleoside phosphorylase
LLVSELIQRKRDGGVLAASDLQAFFQSYMQDRVADYQMSAFLMAVFFRGLDPSELATLTRTIIESGRQLDFSGDGPPAVDKHSTGGVGDKVSLILAPLVAEAGLRVPMISGRGLGHTGGTLDKYESIPGFRTALELNEFEAIVADVGCAVIGQTPEITPLDGRLYALRDVTGTVKSVPLIASSIISKKVAEGVEALVLDVKCGRGAFMQDEAEALELGRVLVDLAASEGVRATGLVTDMETPLGRTIGNALEAKEAIECLLGGGPTDFCWPMAAPPSVSSGRWSARVAIHGWWRIRIVFRSPRSSGSTARGRPARSRAWTPGNLAWRPWSWEPAGPGWRMRWIRAWASSSRCASRTRSNRAILSR